MPSGLSVGDAHILRYLVPANRTVPHLYPESPEFRDFPAVFATGYMIGLMEWCCLEALRPHLEPGEGSLGTMISVSHCAPTPPGLTVTVSAVVETVNGREIVWRVTAKDDFDVIGEGTVGRTLIRWNRFEQKLAAKAMRAAVSDTPVTDRGAS